MTFFVPSKMISGVYLLGLLFASVCYAAPARFEVTSLPGWEGALPSRMWSGFVDVGLASQYTIGKPDAGHMFQHYVFIESEGSPATDPVLVWYNGGPGESSMFGLLVELGPLLLNEESLSRVSNASQPPELLRNPYSWSKAASLLIVDNPPPVGFSYCSSAGQRGDGYSCGAWNDTGVAAVNHAFLCTFFQEQFPEFLKNELYLVGESYAGVYVPVIVQALTRNTCGLNLAGFAVGDGCMGTDVLCGANDGPFYVIEFLYGHGQLSNKLYHSISSTCEEENLKTGHNLSLACMTVVGEAIQAVGAMNDYALYDDCYWKSGQPVDDKKVRRRTSPAAGGWEVVVPNGYPCAGAAMNIWLARADVRNALHVDARATFVDGDNGHGFNYTSTERSVLEIHEKAARQNKLRVLVYTGDTDPGSHPRILQDKWFPFWEKVGLKEAAAWRPWTIDGKTRMGGYVVEYEDNWTFLTVRGSGHMVPEFKPAAALAFITAFLKGDSPPPYSPGPLKGASAKH
ncbi:hypothetical protein CYMTET_4693 [Cymbomonas tetramitiformis]|uniref:Carboxypeptidase n=1 Tax=Cymbomonas tetramitiformis TaxID=36881 RepID=A0AAE0H0V5_9CHLO|nr:hypothetical protein CYMTET_4693 [Cymbomonas tetramitiformis]